MAGGFGGKAASLAANEKTATPKGPLPATKFSDTLKSIAPPADRAPRTTEPATSATGAYARAVGQPSMDNPRTFVAPSDVKPLKQAVSHVNHSLFSKEGNLRSTALINGLLSTGHWNADAANRIHVDKNGKVRLTGTPAQQKEAMGLLGLSGNKWLASAQELLGAGPGFALLAEQGYHNPVGTAGSVAKGIGLSMAGTFTHGHYGSKSNTPLDDALNIWTLGTLGAAGLVKAAGREGEVMAPRSLNVGDTVIHAPTSSNKLAALTQKLHDRMLVHSLNTGAVDLFGKSRFFSNEARIARMARRHVQTESSLAGAPAHELSAYEHLTPAEKHAAWMSLTGHKPADLARAFENGSANAEHIAQLEGQKPEFIRHNHDKLVGLTRAAAEHLDEHGNPTTPRVKAAVEAIRRAIGAREGLKGMDEAAVNHALGSRWYAIQHLAENPTGEGLHAELERLAKEKTPEAATRIEAIHNLFQEKGASIADRASYLPMMNEAKPLRARAAGAVGRQRAQYGFTAPKGEATHEYLGHLLNRGDFRTDAVALAQHSFGKAHHLAAQQALHDMLLGLSKATPEEVGHPNPVPIRKGLLPEELKRFSNILKEKGADAHAQSLWEHLLSGNEDVRFLHPDIANVMKPQTAGEMGRRLNRFNSLVRAQRYLNPKYGIWFAQNATVGLPSQGAKLPLNIARYFKTLKGLDPETYSKIEAGVGSQGMSKSILTPVDTKVTRGLGQFWHHVNDHMFRMAQFVQSASKRGFKSAEDIKRLMNSDDPKMVAERHQILRTANNEAINYSLSPFENKYIRPWMAYYPWTKGASLWTLRFLRDHPLWAQLELEAGRRGKKYVDQFFREHGGLPSPTMEGMFPAKGGPIDMEFANTPSTLAQDTEALLGLGGVQAARKYSIGTALGQSSPIVKAGMDIATGLTSRGRLAQNPAGQALHDLTSGGPLPALKALIGNPPAGQTPQQEFLHYMGWLQEPGVDYNQEAAIGASIAKNALRGPAQVQADVQQKLRQVDQLDGKVPAQYINRFKEYFVREGERNALLAKYAEQNGRHADKYKDGIMSLSYDHPDLYFMGTVETVANLSGRPQLVALAKQRLDYLNALPGYTQEQKATELRKVADKIWENFNPKTIARAYYTSRDRANLP